MTANVAQQERNNDKCYTSAFKYIYIYIYKCGKNYLLIRIKQVQEKLYFKPYYLGGVTN